MRPALVSVLLVALGISSGCESRRLSATTDSGSASRTPLNFIVLFADDLGYGDLGCYGHPTIRTPHIDRMASEGIRFTQFYSAGSLCTPSRAALLTGRLPIRSGMCSHEPRVLFPNSQGGLPAEELTLAELLRSEGYATACIGKWHLGHQPQHLPLNHGFDTFFGLPYSNDMGKVANFPKGREPYDNPKSEYWNVPLIRDKKIVELPVQQETLTRRYTEEAQNFIRANANSPFFLYLPYTMVHVPIFSSAQFRGKSERGRYGDAVEEIDWSVGQILATLKTLGIDRNTVVLFLSDNGPWLDFQEYGGSSGLLRNGKGTTWEGGMRVPCIAWWPGGIKEPGTVSQALGSTMDVFTTFIRLASADIPKDRIIDGIDLTPVLTGQGKSPRTTVAFYRERGLWAWRSGPWKAHFLTETVTGSEEHETPLLFHLGHDPSERFDIAQDHPDVIAAIQREVSQHLDQVTPGKDQLR